MKVLPFLLSLAAFVIIFSLEGKAQNISNYTKAWKKVDSLVEKELPKSALEEVKKIYTSAKKDRKADQLVKSLVYIAQLQNENRENNEVLSLMELESEISRSEPVPAAILKSIVAHAYWQYYQNNRWVFYNRTSTVNFDKKDIATWTLEDLLNRITALYVSSLTPKNLLQQTALSSFEAVIIRGNMRHLRPTIYDLLAFEALDFFERGEIDIKRPAYAFELDQPDAFSPAAIFVNTRFNTRDTLSTKLKALQIYQELLGFHLKDSRPDAFLDADIHRIRFVYENSVHPEKEKLYLAALSGITDKYPSLPAAAQAWYNQALYYQEKGNSFKPYGDSTHRMDLVKAKQICENIVSRRDSSEGKVNCTNLLNEITTRSLEFEVEKVNLPGTPFRGLVSYRNFSGLFLRLIPVDAELQEILSKPYEQGYWPAIRKAKALRQWQLELPLPADLQEHRTEIKIEALPVGEYLLVAADNSDLQTNSLLGARHFYVSAISFINNKDHYFVLHRESGQPLSGAKVQVWQQRYDYSSSKYKLEKAALFTTDNKGHFVFLKNGKERDNYNYRLEITHENDRLFMNDQLRDYYYSYDPSRQPYDTNKAFLFTDRSIYRPGQLLYFKGIVIHKEERRKAISRQDFSTMLYLRNANYEVIDSMKVTSNEYGSFNGSFRLPSSGLNGYFTLVAAKNLGETGFRVEDYKRPKFYVEYEPVKGTYKVNDKIAITGVAKAYAGNNIDGAQVAFRVVRKPRFIYSWMFWRWWQPPVEEMEITHSKTKTDKDGKFRIDFTAIPDLKIDRKFEPVFDYFIYADITDLNGETRSGETSLSVSYKALQMQVSIPETIDADSLKSIYISTTNLNGEHQQANLTVKFYRLQPEQRLIRQRFWERPDQFMLNKKEYVQLFPNDEYDNELDPRSWNKTGIAFEKQDSSRVNGKLPILNSEKLLPGHYEIEIVATKNGEQVRELKYLELTGDAIPARYFWQGYTRTVVEPGDTAKIELGSGATDVFLINELARQDMQPVYTYYSISKEKKSFIFPVSESDRGGFGSSWVFVKNNRYYQSAHTISVPWTNKELQIEYASFRDKTLPGSEKKWKIRISGYKNEKLAAEMLASMYDASLDQFYFHSWNKPDVWPDFYYSGRWEGNENFDAVTSGKSNKSNKNYWVLNKSYDDLIQYDLGNYGRIYLRGARREALPAPKGVSMDEVVVTTVNKVTDGDGVTDSTDKAPKTAVEKSEPSVQVRRNFNETAFFFPELRTDSAGTIEFSFTMPEALTRWKFMALAHSRDGAFGYSSKEIVTQKELMVQPNPPRFLREGDKMEFSSKIVNLSDQEFTGIAELQLFDAVTNEAVDGWFRNMMPKQYFTVAAKQSDVIRFPVEVPYLFGKALVWRIVAKAGNYSDGEENMLPVLTNRMLVTESLPLNMNGAGTKDFSFEKLKNAGQSSTLAHQSLTVEFTSNPAWYAVQALPYLMEYPYECAEQTWNRYYANALASYISNSSPRIRQVFEKWKISDTAALLSNLQKNEELKAVLLEETPWVLEAKTESQQKKNLALLFDMIRMADQLSTTFNKLKQMQSSNGGFVWFSGGPDDRYMTQYIVTGIGHLVKLKAVDPAQQKLLDQVLATAIPYLDQKIRLDYEELLKNKTDLKKYQPGSSIIQYLYMRSFFPQYLVAAASKKAVDYFRSRLASSWTSQNKYMQAMIALTLHRAGDKNNAAAILRSLKETAILSEEMGMYYKDQPRGWFWYQSPIETQALVIEAFEEIANDRATADALRTWLLKNKQTNNWGTTKSTAEACYALLLRGSSWIGETSAITVKLGRTSISSSTNKTEAGTGYFKTSIEGKNIDPEMGNIRVTVEATKESNNRPTWGAVYWQYFEDLDKITTAATPLSLKKKLFIEKNTDRGPVLSPVNDGDMIRVGDKIKVRIELRADRDMEYVHMKDMRASALEPVNVLSSYRWQGGLGYYESTRDASTNFFIDHLRKGTYVFEYTLFATHAGNFSNGVTSIQCMYAPEFGAHSEGIRINIEGNE